MLVRATSRQNLSEVLHGIILISNGNGGARIGQGECRARTVFKIDFELGLGLINGFYFAMVRINERHESSPRADSLAL